MNVAIFHNIMWSKYKGGVFSAIHSAIQGTTTRVTFTQIAETEGERIALGGVDLSFHQYPYELIFKGSYHSTSLFKRTLSLAHRAWRCDANVVVLPGYERPEYWAMLFILAIRRKRRAVFCDSTAYDRPNHFWKSLAKRFFFANCHGFFGYGIRSREYLMMHGADPSTIFYRCQAAALPADYSEKEAIIRRVENGPKPGFAPRFLYVGRLSKEKGLDTLIYALARLRKYSADAQVVIVGAGPLADELKKIADESGVAKAVHFLGSQTIHELAIEYSKSTALVLPSTSEPWGLVVNEALSYGCPAVVSNICGCVPELVHDGETGYSFQSNSVEDLSKAMLKAVTDFSDLEKVAVKCTSVMDDFSPKHAAEQILEGCRLIAQRNK